MTVQKLRPTIDSEFEVAKRYYKVVSTLNGIDLKNLELNLLAWIAVKGSISNTNNRDVFCQTFDSTKSSVYNVVNKLTKRGFLYKIDNKIKIIPSISLNFKETVVIKITLDAETGEQAG